MSKNHRGSLAGFRSEMSGAITNSEQLAVICSYPSKLKPKEVNCSNVIGTAVLF